MSYSQRQLQAIFQKTDGRCGVCGFQHVMAGYPHDWEVDHIYPVSQGGNDGIHNLQVCCVECNRDKGDGVHIVDAVFEGLGE